MSESQIIFRLENQLLKKFDRTLSKVGYKSRNEWFRVKVREFLDEIERKETLRMLDKFTVQGISEEDIVKMVNDWRKKDRGN